LGEDFAIWFDFGTVTCEEEYLLFCTEIFPVTLVSYRDVPTAFKEFGAEQNEGKIVVKMTPNSDYKPPSFFPSDASYLIAGGVQYVRRER
jgi:hypothetical protein